MKLFFRRFGRGNPVVILHGLFGVSDNWVTIGRRLAEDFEVYIPDLRNHGQSPHSPVFSISALAEDLTDFIEENSLEDIILIGHSLGGLVSMQCVLQYPHIAAKIIVVDISLRKNHNYEEHIQLIDTMRDVDFSGVRKRSDVEKQLMSRIKSPKLRNLLLKNVYWRDKDNLDWQLNLPALYENLPFKYEDTTGENRFNGPALFIRGGLSDYIKDKDFEEICKKFPRAQLSTIPNATHWVHADAPENFLEVVRRFLLPDNQ
jgi:esterase